MIEEAYWGEGVMEKFLAGWEFNGWKAYCGLVIVASLIVRLLVCLLRACELDPPLPLPAGSDLRSFLLRTGVFFRGFHGKPAAGKEKGETTGQ